MLPDASLPEIAVVLMLLKSRGSSAVTVKMPATKATLLFIVKTALISSLTSAPC